VSRRKLKPCGTRAAYRRHLRRGEDACEACKTAERGGPRKPVRVAQCGTYSGYKRHRRLNEAACAACRAANTAYAISYKQTRGEAA
jgi:hypothetical protein